MTTIIIDAPRFDIGLTESPGFDGTPRYLLRYGLGTTVYGTLAGAVRGFQESLAHAMALDFEGATPAELPPGYIVRPCEGLEAGRWVYVTPENREPVENWHSRPEAIQAAWEDYRTA